MAEHPAVVFLLAAHQRAEVLARAAGWVEIEAVSYLWETRYLSLRQPDGEVRHTTEFSAELADHFAVHSPASVLRRVAAERELLAEHADELGLGECRVCAVEGTVGAITFQGNVPWPCRTMLLLAEAWGWEVEHG